MLKKLLLVSFSILFPLQAHAADERIQAGRLDILVPDGMNLVWENAFVGNVSIYSDEYLKTEWERNFTLDDSMSEN